MSGCGSRQPSTVRGFRSALRGKADHQAETSRQLLMTQTGLSVARYFLLINRRPPTPSRVTICHQTDKRVRWLHAVRNEHGLRVTFEHEPWAIAESMPSTLPLMTPSKVDSAARPARFLGKRHNRRTGSSRLVNSRILGRADRSDSTS